jgi:hypothetical protein
MPPGRPYFLKPSPDVLSSVLGISIVRLKWTVGMADDSDLTWTSTMVAVWW